MSRLDIIRAWKDEDYANSLTDAEKTMLPQNPAGFVELADEDMAQAAGGTIITLGLICSLALSCISF